MSFTSRSIDKDLNAFWTLIATSTIEAEFVSYFEATSHDIWLKSFIFDIWLKSFIFELRVVVSISKLLKL
ncbi:hypothetical protein CR513_29760, partial [Mucuna pruriens]